MNKPKPIAKVKKVQPVPVRTGCCDAEAAKNKNGMKKKKHPGFKAVASKIASKEGVGKKAAGAILASASRKASAGAKRRNPRLKKV